MIKNQIKTVLLLGGLTALLLFIGSLIGGRAGLTIALIFAGGINFISFWFSHKIVLKIYKAKEADRNKYGKLYSMIQEIAVTAKVPMPKVYIVPSQHPNAFACGPTYKKSAVAFTEGILNLLNDNELKGVAAHEISHIKNRDTLISTIAATIAGVISYIAMMARWSAIFGGFGGDRDKGNIVELLLLAILAPILALIIQLAISRSREFVADESGAMLIKDPFSLASALEKIEKGVSHAPLKAQGTTEATAHLFIANPFRGFGLWKLLSTHPDTKERCKRLRSMNL